MAKKTLKTQYPRLAAIDIGSNAMRMQVAELQPGFVLTPVKSLRVPVRLGHDVFANELISEATLTRALKAFRTFADGMARLKVQQYMAVATSATREAENRQRFLDLVRKETGIEVQLLPGEEEARMVYLAVQRRLPLGDRNVLVVDIGGGSVELILGQGGQVQALESLKMGTVRMLARLGGNDSRPADFIRRAHEYVEAARSWVDYWLAQHPVDLVVATGGNSEEVGDLARKLFQKPGNDLVSAAELRHILGLVESLSVEERKKRLGLRADRADVFLPALIVLNSLVEQTGVHSLVIPHVGLKDGLLEDLRFQALGQRPDGLDPQQVLAAVLQLGRKYDFDEGHARKVSDLSLQLFDGLQPVHKLGPSARLLLEAGALLHDIGKFINFSGHHKHSQYIVESTPLVGLSLRQRKVVAAITRYHRKNTPSLQQESFRQLPVEDRVLVIKLSSLLRLAEALDAEHGGMVDQLQVRLAKNRAQLSLQGQGDLMLERWSAANKMGPLEKAFGLKFSLELQ